MRLLTTVATRPSSLVTPSFRDAPAGTRGHAGPRDSSAVHTDSVADSPVPGRHVRLCLRSGWSRRQGRSLTFGNYPRM